MVVDTSGSMSAKQIGMALGSIASYAAAKDVPFVRIIFCDAKATDAGYLAPEDIHVYSIDEIMCEGKTRACISASERKPAAVPGTGRSVLFSGIVRRSLCLCKKR